MKAIIKSFCFSVSAFAMAFAARAVDPVAVWSGFNQLKSGPFTANIGSLVPDATTGAVTLGLNGIKFANAGDAWSGSTKGFTVAIKYSNFKSGTAASLVSLQQNSETTAAGINKIGAWVNASGKVQGVWEGNAWGTAYGTLPASGVVFLRYNDSNGTQIYMQDKTLMFGASNLKSSNNNWGKSFAVGSFANGTSNVASGMTIEAVAIFDSRLSDADMTNYAFPEPEPATFETLTFENFLTTTFVDTGWNFDLTKLDECEISGMMSGSSIANRPAASTGYWMEPAASATSVAKFQMQVYQYNGSDDHWLKAVEVELKKGDNGSIWIRGVRAGYTDGGLSDPKGSIKITNWNSTLATSETAGGYGVCKVVVKVPVAEAPKSRGVIAVNFLNADNATYRIGENDDSGILDISMTGSAWNQYTTPSRGSAAKSTVTQNNLKVYDEISGETATSTASITWSAKEPWKNDSASPVFHRSWLEDGDANSGPVNISVSSIPFASYDVYVYMGGSSSHGPVSVNGTMYAYVNGELTGGVASTRSWGSGATGNPAVGTDTMLVEGESGNLTVVGTKNGTNPRCNIAAIVIREKTATPQPSAAEATIDDDSTWEELWSEDNPAPTAKQKVNLTVEGSPTLTLDEVPACGRVTLKGSGNITFAIPGAIAEDTITKFSFASFTGKATFRINVSANATAGDQLKNLMKTGGNKYTFIFSSTAQNKGATINYGDTNITDGQSFGTHIVFEGGTHTFQYRAESSGLKFGANATENNPTIWVKGNATLNFNGRNLCGWSSGNANTAGIVRVDAGSTLNLTAVGGTLYWAQRFYLEPGAIFNFNSPNVTGGSAFRLNGGTAEATAQIYVPASDGTKGTAIVKQTGDGGLMTNAEAGNGFAIFVGEGSALKIDASMAKAGGNSDANIVKYGAGGLQVTGDVSNQLLEIAAGSFGSAGTIKALTLDNDVALNLDYGAPTISTTFTAAKQLNLTIAEPTHMMPVITLPAAADKTGWTAVVNGNTANPCELVADGNTLKLKWKIPPTIEINADDVTIETADDWNGGVVKVDISKLNKGDYEDDIRYRLRFGDKVVAGTVNGSSASFTLDPSDFTAGNIYRGTFELEYGEGNPAIVAAEVTVYAGEKTYGEKEGWINEKPEPLVFRSTGVYNPESGAAVDDGLIKFSNPTDVVFTPTNSPADYVAKCDSEVTFEIFSGEEAIQDDDDTVADDLQAGVKIVDNGSGGVKFQFVSGDEWIDGPAATLNATYTVTVNFHYAKEAGDTDSVTYTVGETVVPCERRANVAEKLETISFADGTKIASLIGTCQIEVADPITKGLEPGANGKDLKATDEATAQAEAAKIPVVVPSVVADALAGADDVEKAKADYKANFKVVAQKGADGKFVAVVIPTEEAEQKAENEVQKISADVLAEVTALTGDQTEGTATINEAVPGFFYGVAEDGEVVKMKTAEPDEWKIAGATGKVELKVTKPVNAKQRFYKVVCSPLPKSAK